MRHLLLKNKQKIHNYRILNSKCTAKKITGKWTDISVFGDQRVNYIDFKPLPQRNKLNTIHQYYVKNAN